MHSTVEIAVTDADRFTSSFEKTDSPKYFPAPIFVINWLFFEISTSPLQIK